MKNTDAYRIAVEDNNIVIRLNRDLVYRDAFARLRDYIELESIRKRSSLTEPQASMLAKEVDCNAWESTKHKYTEE